jgi:hypothetical protein
VSCVRYELGFYIPEDDILHSHRRENLKSYINQETTWGPVIRKIAIMFQKFFAAISFQFQLNSILS